MENLDAYQGEHKGKTSKCYLVATWTGNCFILQVRAF